jgi:hypothetical protein
VQPVPAPPLVGRRVARHGARRAALLLAAAILVAAAAIWVAVSSQGRHDQPVAQSARAAAYNGLIGGVPLQSARCVQWNAGTAAEREKVAAALSYSVGGATPYGPGTTLSSAQALSLFDHACSSAIARHWLLYELYIRAAGFHAYVPR